MREAVATVTVSCSLAITEADVKRALHQEGPDPFDLPRRHPLAAYDLDGAVCGPVPRVLKLWAFEWAGGAASGSVRALRRFAGLTRGAATFLLVDERGRERAFEIQDGRLFACDVEIRFTRKKRGRR